MKYLVLFVKQFYVKGQGMNSYKNVLVIVASVMLFGCGSVAQHKDGMNAEEYRTMFDKIASVDDVMKLFPRTVAEVKNMQDLCIKEAQKGLDELLKIDASQRTFENTARFLDKIQARFRTTASSLHCYEMVCPDEALRNACHDAVIALQQYAVDAFSCNIAMYNAFKDYVEGNAKKETLSPEEHYFLEEAMRDFKREGLHLGEEKLEEVKKLKKELAELEMAYDMNAAKEEELAGVDANMIKNFKRDDKGNCMVTCDYPTYHEVMDNCTVGQTRKQLYFAYMNRAYPQNLDVLHKVIAQRDDLAKRLGFASYAALDIDAAMAKNPERSEKFVYDLVALSQKKSRKRDQCIYARITCGCFA